MSASAISVQGLRVRRGDKLVVREISLEVRPGVVTGLLGPSGSGKTTLLRAIVGVQIVESGTVTVLGLPAGSPGLRRRVAYVTQAPSVYPDLSVRENLGYFARILDVPAERIEDAIGVVDLAPQADQVVRTLSGGERSRVSLATALLGDPDVLVLDEPTVGLDPVSAATSGPPSTGSPKPAPRCSSPATSWTRRSAATSWCFSARAASSRRPLRRPCSS